MWCSVVLGWEGFLHQHLSRLGAICFISLSQIMLVVNVYSEVVSFVGEFIITQWRFPNYKLCKGIRCVTTASKVDHVDSSHLGTIQFPVS